MLLAVGLFLWVQARLSLAVPLPSDELLRAEQQAFTKAVQSASAWVVQIEIFGAMERVDQQLVSQAPLTGTIVGEEGWIVTSMHGLRQAPASILVTLPSGNRSSARIVARDYSRDIVLLKVEVADPLQVAKPADTSKLEVGQWCVALGKTYDARSVTQSAGIVSALGRAYGRAVQTDAKVSPINYGGPLIDLSGRVIGILAPIAAAEMLEDDGLVLYDSGIGFAIPLADILIRLPKMQSGQDIRAGRLGVVNQSQNELAGPVQLTGAAPGSPAAKAGVKSGDTVLEAAGKPIQLLADLREALAAHDAGQQFNFRVKRGEQLLDLSCELVADIPPYRRRRLGLHVTPVEGGLQIRSVANDTAAMRAELKPGQTITQVDQTIIKKRVDLERILSVAELDVPLNLHVKDTAEGQQRVVPLTPASWPEEMPESPVQRIEYLDEQNKPDASAKVVATQIKLADLPNQIQALIPPRIEKSNPGCLILFGQPGPVEAEKFKLAWEDLCSGYGWIVLQAASADANTWTPDESELVGRLLARMGQEYSIDSGRVAVAGLGIGGQLALRATMMNRQQVRGVMTIGTKLRPFAIRSGNAPMQCLDFLFVTADKSGEELIGPLTKRGFAAHAQAAQGLDIDKWNSVPMQPIVRWLELLGQL